MSELEGDRYLIAINGYLNARHNIALRLLAECDKEAEEDDIAKENKLRDDALTATVARDYQSAHHATSQLVSMQARKDRSAALRKQLREECDRLCSARAIIEKRGELLEKAPKCIQDPYMGGVGAYLQTRKDITLRLLAAIDAERGRVEPGSEAALELQQRRERFSLELDALLAALQAHEAQEELLDSASGVLGEGTPDTSSYLRRVLAYLDARSTIVLRIVAFLDEQLSRTGSPVAVDGPLDARVHLTRRRAELVEELDRINEQVAAQKLGEAELRAVGLPGTAGYGVEAKVAYFLQSRSEMSLQLLAFLEGRLSNLEPAAGAQERAALASRRDALRLETDDTLAQLAQQQQGQALLESLGCAAVAAA